MAAFLKKMHFKGHFGLFWPHILTQLIEKIQNLKSSRHFELPDACFEPFYVFFAFKGYLEPFWGHIPTQVIERIQNPSFSRHFELSDACFEACYVFLHLKGMWNPFEVIFRRSSSKGVTILHSRVISMDLIAVLTDFTFFVCGIPV